jgi:hypothetical protein
MNVLDPRGGGRMLWTGAVIEGDRDPSDPAAGFPLVWTAARGWFGVLTLPRVLQLANDTLDDGSADVYLATPPLPELAALRSPLHAVDTMIDLAGAVAASALTLRGRSVEVMAKFAMPAWDATGWDVGVQYVCGA